MRDRLRIVAFVLCTLVASLLLCSGVIAAAEISFYVTVFGDLRTQVTRELVDEFEAQHPGVTVNLIEAVPAETEERLLLLLASGNPPDVMNLDVGNAAQIYASGQALPLDPFIARDGFDTSQISPAIAAEFLQHDGVWYGLPFAGGPLGQGVLFYNRDLFSDVGLAFPVYNPDELRTEWTWEEFRTVTQRLTIVPDGGEPEQWGFGFGPGRVRLHYKTWAWSNGGDILSADRSRSLITEPAFVEAVQWWADLRNTDGVIVEPQGRHRNMWLSGRLGIWEGSYVNIGQYSSQNLPFDWALATWPQGSAGTVPRGDSLPLAISAETAHPDVAWELVKYFLSDDVQFRLVVEALTIPPQLLGIVRQPEFWSLPAPPYDLRPSVSPLTRAEPVSHPRWQEIDDVIYQHVQSVWNGQESARAAMERAAPIVDAILQEQ